MSLNRVFNARHKLRILVFAGLLALAATYSPMLVDQMSGSSITAQVHACSGPQTSGGDC